MAEFVVGHEFVREPDEMLPEGSIVETHTHNNQHNTHFNAGLWEIHRFLPLLNEQDEQVRGKDNELLWYAMPLMTIQGGGPRSILNIPANMRHKFVLKKGGGHYRCVFPHRDGEGNLTEVFEGYRKAYC